VTKARRSSTRPEHRGDETEHPGDTPRAAGAPYFLSKHVSCSIVNAGDGANEHPPRAPGSLHDPEGEGKGSGLKIAIVGDVLHSRVVRSDLHSLGRMGATCGSAGPRPLPEGDGAERSAGDRRHPGGGDGRRRGLHAPNPLERQKTATFPSLREYSRKFGLNRAVFALAKSDAVIMHPGPVNRGVELSDELADSAQSRI